MTALHGGKSQDGREAALSEFKDGKFEIIVCTDVAGRGIDVSGARMHRHVCIPVYMCASYTVCVCVHMYIHGYIVCAYEDACMHLAHACRWPRD